MEHLNSQLRQIHSELRRQRELTGGNGGSTGPSARSVLISALGQQQQPADSSSPAASTTDTEAIARDMLATAAAEMAAARSALEASLHAPSAPHPWERLGPARLPMAGARRRIAAAIRDTKLLLRQVQAEGMPPAAAAGGQGLGAGGPAPASDWAAAGAPDPLGHCFDLLDEAERLGDEMRDVRAVRAAVHLRAKGLRLAGGQGYLLRQGRDACAMRGGKRVGTSGQPGSCGWEGGTWQA